MDTSKVQDMVKQLIGHAKATSDQALADRLSLDIHNADLQKQAMDRLAVIMPAVPPTVKPDTKPKAKATKPKPKAKATQSGPYDPQKDLVSWFTAHVDNRVPTDRANGYVYNAKVNGHDKKVIKTPTFENVGGVFFGAVLNPHLAKVKGCKHHPKSNVYKVGKDADKATVKAIKRAIVKTVDQYNGPKL